MTDADRWLIVRKVIEEAMHLEAEDRPIFINAACGDDATLRGEVEALLALHDGSGNFLEEPIGHIADLQDLVLLDAPLAGLRVGSYRLERQLGRGGMGSVWLAERVDGEYHKSVAIKLLDFAAGAGELVERFLAERQILAQLEHPNIARLLDGGTTLEGLPYIVMEYVEGLPIDTYCDNNLLGVRERIELFCQVCLAVGHAHRRFVVHRDIKPSNILVNANGEPKLLDFGIAKLLASDGSSESLKAISTRVFTPRYASPEQIQGTAVSYSTDIFSLGVILYGLLTGFHPCREQPADVQEMMRLICEERPQKPSEAVLRSGARNCEQVAAARKETATSLPKALAGTLDTITLKALHKEPNRRYRSVDTFVESMEGYLRSNSDAKATTGGQILWEEIKRPRGFFSVLALSAVAASLMMAPFSNGSISVRTIAVLPFDEPRSADKGSYFGNTVADEVSANLGKITSLTVIGSAATRGYKGQSRPLPEIGQELGAGAVLTGSLQKNGTKVRIVASLVEPKTGQQLWSEIYERPFSDIFVIENDIAKGVAGALRLPLPTEDVQGLSSRRTANLTAYDYYSRGREYYYLYRPESNEIAIKLFKTALELDPKFALAQAGLGDAYASKGGMFGVDDTWLQAASEAAQRAIVLAPDSPEGYKAIGAVNLYRGHYSKGLFILRRATELNHSYAPAVANYGVALYLKGQLEEAVKWKRRAISLNPTKAGYYLALGDIYATIEDDRRAGDMFKKTLALQPGMPEAQAFLVRWYLARGEYREAAQAADAEIAALHNPIEAHELAGEVELWVGRLDRAKRHFLSALVAGSGQIAFNSRHNPTTSLGYIEWETGSKTRAQKYLRDASSQNRYAIGRGDENPALPYDNAAIYAILGNKKESNRWLQKAVELGWRDRRCIMKDPLLRGIRASPEFRQTISKLETLLQTAKGHIAATTSLEDP
jgi:eukaryotic-like serine/threonine-protein kinase